MEQELLALLADTQSPAEGPRKHAEAQLEQLYHNEAFPMSLASVASHASVPLNLRQSALLVLKTFVLSAWSPQLDEFKGQVLVNESNKEQLRVVLFELATNGENDRKVTKAASYVVSKIAYADYPDHWPTLLPSLLHLIPTGSDAQIHGALKVLGDLVADGLNEEQFFKIARDLIKVVYDVAINDTRKPNLRALGVSVFRSCFEILEIVMEDHKEAVSGFASESLSAWSPFFLEVMKMPMPDVPKEEEEINDSPIQEHHRGIIALKLQVVKTLMKIRLVFPALLSPQSPILFTAVWEELSTLQASFHEMYINDERQGRTPSFLETEPCISHWLLTIPFGVGRLEDADGLPYTLDFLVLEELDFMQSCLRATPVKKALEAQLQSQISLNGASGGSWVIEVMKLVVAYAQITTEEEGLWDIDVNVFLSEETSVTANYTPRTACGDLVIKLSEWLPRLAVEGLMEYTKAVFSLPQASWKEKEAALYILNQLLSDFLDVDRKVGHELAGFIEFINHAIACNDQMFLRARGFLVAGILAKTIDKPLQPIFTSFMEHSIKSIAEDGSEVVQVSCIRAVQDYIHALPHESTLPMQTPIISALSSFLSSKDLVELSESDDLMVTIVETLRDAILLNSGICIAPQSSTLDLLFTIGSRGANNYQLTALVNETFVDIASSISAMGGESYIRLCEKVLPSLTGAFDVGNMTGQNSLTNLAAELLSVLAEYGSEPLPNGFVGAVMPKLNALLLSSSDAELLRPGTEAVKHMLVHDHQQIFEWHDQEGKSGLEICLVIIDRLLRENMEDHAATEVGGLAAELVEKAGAERLGPYLLQLLRAVAVRLASAQEAAFIQSLILVFARLSLVGAKDVVDFLAQVQVENESGLQVVMGKWLQNSVNFAGYDQIRQNVIALSKLYTLADPRLAQTMVQGDLIVPTSSRIMTRSRTRNTPDQYTTIPVPLKIIKVLIEELSSASGNTSGLEAAALELDEAGSDNGDWEDEPNFLDLGLSMTKQDLMALGDDNVGAERQRDDETQAYLTEFFKGVEAGNIAGFRDWYGQLTAEERGKLSVVG
ncbi:MAG: hypothetical protein M1829_004741 [Trizodia sp. TS-e1964]|nr:MAG: hypothetical protein M1829_004741 [Trizodia sp. TS-e1964]